MKILTVIMDLGPGGMQRVAENYTLGYNESGVESAILAYRGGGVREENLYKKGIPVFIGGPLESEMMSSVFAALEWGPDVIHIHRTGYPDKDSGKVLRALADKHLKIMETNVFGRFDPTPDGGRIDIHLLLSHWCLWKYQRWSSRMVPQPIAVVVPNAVVSKEFYPLSDAEKCDVRREWGVPENAFVFGRVGQPNRPKWSPCIFNAFENIAKHNPDVYLILAGLPSSYERYIDKLPSDVRCRVRVLPFQYGDTRLRRLYGGFDVFLHAAQIGESFGMVLCEAMLCGIPVITLATPCKDNSQIEVVGHKISGLVVRDKKYLCEAMSILIKDRLLYKKLSDQAPQWVHSQFDISVVIPRLTLIARLLNSVRDRDEIKASLLKSSEFRGISEWSILSLELKRSIGSAPVFEEYMRRLVHMPLLYDIWRKTKNKIIGARNVLNNL